MIDKETRMKIVDEYAAGVNIYAIAAAYGVSHNTPQRMAQKFGIKRRRPRNRKVAVSKEFEIIEAYLLTSATYKEMAARFGVTVMQISNILDRNAIQKNRRIPKHDDE